MIRVLVAEDSVTARELMVAVLRADPEIQVVGEAKNGVEAIEMTRELRPHVVTMDIHMPRLNGFEATKAIMREVPTPVVIVSGSVDPNEVAASMHALQAGALALLPKPPGPESPQFEQAGRLLVHTVKAMAGVKVVRHWAPRAEVDKPALAHNPARPRILALAASTGGPSALQHILSQLSPRVPVPIVIVQHIAAGFAPGFARWLDTVSALRVRVVAERERLENATLYLAAEDRHLIVEPNGWAVASAAPPLQGFRPSATHLFQSVAQVYGTAGVAVVLTGMGEDGLPGLRAVRAAGGRVVAQNEESSVVFGMPGAAVGEGLADAVLPLPKIAGYLEELLQ